MFKIDTHVHTSEVSFCGNISASTVISAYKAKGYGGIVITDHLAKYTFDRLGGKTWAEKVEMYLKGYNAAKAAGEKHGIKVFLGMELKNFESGNDYLVFGVTREFLLKHEWLYKKTMSELRQTFEKNNMLIVQAHPFRDGCIPADSCLLDGVEGFNGHFNQNSRNDMAGELAKKYGKLILSGSDCHDIIDVGNGGIILDSAPETDDFVQILKEMPYTLIKTEPQLTNLLVMNEAAANSKNLRAAAKEKNADAVVLLYSGDNSQRSQKGSIGDLPVIYICVDGNEQKPLQTCGRCQLASETNFASIDAFEPAVLFCDEINQELESMADAPNVLVVVCNKSGGNALWEKNKTHFAALDTPKRHPCAFGVSIKGPVAHIELVEL